MAITKEQDAAVKRLLARLPAQLIAGRNNFFIICAFSVVLAVVKIPSVRFAVPQIIC